jgi:uncharacterized membrane protein
MHGRLWYFGDSFNSGCFSNPWIFTGLRVAGFIVTVAVVILVFRYFTKKNGPDDELIQLLKLKFVNGEISEDEYIAKLNTLKK